MESTKAYLARKERELTFLASQLREPVQVSAHSVAEVVDQKYDLRTRLLAELVARRPDLTESWRYPGRPQPHAGHHLKYFYQRFDLEVDGPDLYADWGVPRVTSTRFTSCGMGALSAVFLGLQKLIDTARVVIPCDAYFETIELCRHLLKSLDVHVATSPADATQALRCGQRPRVLVVDSLAVADPISYLEGLTPADVDLVVFDTTLYDLASDRNAAVVQAVFALKTPVIAVRSHLKLDFLGTEWGRLGSVVGLMHPAQTLPLRQRLYRELMDHVDFAIRWVGTGPNPLFLLPYAQDPVFGSLNTERLGHLAANNHWLATELRGRLSHVVGFHHGRFITIDPYPAPDNFEQIQDAIRRLYEAGTELAIRPGNSFGFDFTALAASADGHRGGRRVLRVAAGDQPAEVMKATRNLLLELLR
jgi:hypothetical protein